MLVAQLEFQQRHRHQHGWVPLAILGASKNGFRERLDMSGGDRMRQGGDSSVQCFLHDPDQRRWKRRVGKILHVVPSESKFPVNRGFIRSHR
jgi:hypothetical protein